MSRQEPTHAGRVSLKTLAAYLHLSPATISFVLNNAPNRSIPEATRDRVRAAAKLFNYQPNVAARMLQRKSTQTIGILLPELGEGYHAQVLSGAADVLMQERYFFFTAHHRHHADLVAEYPQIMLARGVEGIISIDTHLAEMPPCPTVEVASRTKMTGSTNIVLDHRRAAQLTLEYLHGGGHRRIAFMKGPPCSSDTERRWQATVTVARELGLRIPRELVVQLPDLNTPELGYSAMRELLGRTQGFTAVLCFNDISAFGCIRALHEAGLAVPESVSVIGFDDIQTAAYHVPSLTTIQQPLHRMGAMAAELLIKKLRGENTGNTLSLEPVLIERESSRGLQVLSAV